MVTRGLSDLFQSFYSDDEFKSHLIHSPEKALSSGHYQLNSEEIKLVKAFIKKDWGEFSIKSPAEGHRENGSSVCNACGCGCAGCSCWDK